MTSDVYVHYGAAASLFSAKTRAYLRHKGIPFEDRAVDRTVYRDIILPHVKRKVVPVVVTPEGEVLQDSTVIIDTLERRFPTPSVYPETPFQRLVALLVELYADEWLVMAALHYRWHYLRENLAYIMNEFGTLMAPGASKPRRILASVPPTLTFGIVARPFHGVTPRVVRALEASTEALVADLDRHFASHRFLLGSRPCLGDFALIGTFYAHIYRDPYSSKWLRARAPNVVDWVERTQFSEEPGDGALLPDDEIPATLEPVLARLFREQFPVLIDTVARVDAWARKNPTRARPPRAIGWHAYHLGAARGRRCVQPYQQWMFQRPLDYFRSLGPSEHARIDPVLERLGGLTSLRTRIPTRVAFERYCIFVEGREPAHWRAATPG